MVQFTKWIKSAVQQIVDPEKEQRVDQLVAMLERQLQAQRREFSLDAFIERVDHSSRDLEQAKQIVFQRVIERTWQKGKVSVAGKETLQWLAERLQIPAHEAFSRRLDASRKRFAVAIAAAMEDGILDELETQQLQDIASSVEFSLGEFVRKFFPAEGEQFLRGIFAACTENGVLADEAWNQLVKTTTRLGLAKTELTEAIRLPAERFIEHVLADAKSDGFLSENEESILMMLISKLGLAPASTDYIRRHIRALRTMRFASQGKLPSISPPLGIAIRAGEIIHFHAPSKWLQRKILKSGDRWDEHVGTLTITDNRLLFCSDTKSFDVRFAKIASHSGRTGVLRLQRVEKLESAIYVDEEEPVLHSILECAIAFANQTRLARQTVDSTRHIPRDVRQRVWQRYGGRCAECGATDYLEFDHIVPVAKGGSNSDANVQLLCRACNQKKSAFI